MKRIGQVFDTMCSLENIEIAHYNARKGKRHYGEVRKVEASPGFYFRRLRNLLVSGEYRTSPYTHMVRECSGKTRQIAKLPYFPDRIVHHCIAQVLGPVWTRMMIRDTYACIQGRGIHDGVNRIRRALAEDREATAYCLKMDVAQFYPSIDHAALKAVLRRKLKDRRLLALLDEIIDSWSPGVPIGNYLSQYFGNIYLSGYDHWIKETQRRRYYYRYCDDVVILAADKTDLHRLRKQTEAYWRENLNLKLKSNWQVFPVDVRGIDFLGYRFFRNYTLLRKSTAMRFKRRIAQIKKNGHGMPPKSIISSVMSYYGWLKPANCLHLRCAHIDAELKSVVGRAARILNIRNPLHKVMK